MKYALHLGMYRFEFQRYRFIHTRGKKLLLRPKGKEIN